MTNNLSQSIQVQMQAEFYRITAAENDLFQSCRVNMQLFLFGDILSIFWSLAIANTSTLHSHPPTHTNTYTYLHEHEH